MEAVLAHGLFNQRKESFDDSSNTTTTAPNKTIVFICRFLGFVLGCYAVYLSWTCNAKPSKCVGFLERLLKALAAFTFSGFYLIWYAISRCPECLTSSV